MQGVASVRQKLLRRLSAKRRIGCDYAVTYMRQSDAFDAKSWLPASERSYSSMENTEDSGSEKARFDSTSLRKNCASCGPSRTKQ